MGNKGEKKRKRAGVFEGPTKKQQMILWTEVIGFSVRYLELMVAFETISAVVGKWITASLLRRLQKEGKAYKERGL